ncbi:MAG: hypothetical protein AMXMBFR80_06180 [Dehalococcoidia bacterium]
MVPTPTRRRQFAPGNIVESGSASKGDAAGSTAVRAAPAVTTAQTYIVLPNAVPAFPAATLPGMWFRSRKGAIE